jgi:hypothetical protein
MTFHTDNLSGGAVVGRKLESREFFNIIFMDVKSMKIIFEIGFKVSSKKDLNLLVLNRFINNIPRRFLLSSFDYKECRAKIRDAISQALYFKDRYKFTIGRFNLAAKNFFFNIGLFKKSIFLPPYLSFFINYTFPKSIKSNFKLVKPF